MIKRNKVSEAISLVLVTSILGATDVIAQEDDTSADNTEVIEVRGIRSSIARSMAIKQDATGFVDAISAEDVGKLPDANIAEALQRVTGVAIQRNRGEGDFVSIRGLGPDFVRGTVNGRSLLSATESVDPILNGNSPQSTGRAANFDTLPSEIISTLEVVKSTSAKHVEGGIGGVVNIVTARPLEVGNKVSGSVQGVYRDANEETDPMLSGLASWKNDDSSFGILGAIAFSERNIREDVTRTFGYFPTSAVGTTGPFDTNNDGVSDGVISIPFSLSNNLNSYAEERERVTVNATAQWLPDENTEVVLDLMYSQRDVRSTGFNMIFLPIPSAGDLAGQPVNADGSTQIGDLLTDGVFTTIPSSLRPEMTTDLQDGQDDVFTFGLNVEKTFDSWVLNADVSYSKAEGSNSFDRVRYDADNGTFSFVTNVLSDGFSIQQLNAGGGEETSLANPANYVVSVFDDRIATNEDTELAFQFDAVREIDSEFVSSIETGIRYRTREKERTSADNGNGIGGLVAAGITAADAGFVRGTESFLDGDINNSFAYSDLVFPVNASARAALVGYLADNGLTTEIADNPFGTFDVEEDTFAAYFQVNLEGDFGDVPFIGDVGLRIVQTQQDINGFDAELRIQDNGGRDGTVFDGLTVGSPTAFSSDTTYTSVLPSFNLRFEVAEGLFLRLAGSETLTRPTFNDLQPGLSVNANCSCDVNGDNFAINGNAGNPGLLPYEATNFDLGVEWYFEDENALYAGLFYKELENYIAAVTNNDVNMLGSAAIRAIGIEQDGSSNPIALDQLTQPDNQGVAEVSGIELGYVHVFDSGFGYNLNMTLTENSAEFEDSGSPIDFPGVSDTSYNGTVFYEKDGFSTRLSYSYRSDYLLIPDAIGVGGQIFAEEYGQLDGSISYDINEKVTIFANAVNLANEEQILSLVAPNGSRNFISRAFVGPRYTIGVRATF